MRRNNFALRLQPSLMEEARKGAESEGVALNQLINVALAEKLSAMRTEEYFQERIRRAEGSETMRILGRSGRGKPPERQDELPPDLAPHEQGAGEESKPAKSAAPQFGKIKKRPEKS